MNKHLRSQSKHPAITFLKSLYQHCEEGFINLRFLPSAKNLFIPLSNIDSIPTILEAHKNQNTYFGVGTRVNDDGSKTGILQIPALWVDVDMEGFSEEKKNEIRQRYQDFPLKPFFLLNSGGGLHIYWLLKVPASKEEIPQVENLLKRLASYFNGDMGSTDASRILRIPKTLNYKYTPPREVTIESFKLENEYNLDDFDFLSIAETEEIEKIPRVTPGWEKELLEGVLEGERNIAITRLAGRYVGKGLLKEEILPILMDVNSRFKPPLNDKEIEKTLDSVIRTNTRNYLDEIRKEKIDCKHINYHLTTLDDVFEYPDVAYLIDPILPEGIISVLGAYTGTGKSITALSIIKSIISGDPLWGKYPVTKTGAVLLVDEETPKEFLKDRVRKMGFVSGLPIYFLHFQDVRLDKDDYFNELIAKIQTIKPILVVIDSLIRVHRQKEDDAMAMSLVVARLRKIANSGITVLVIHHHKKGDAPLSQKLRGSSDIPGGVDIEYAIIPKDDYLIFSSVKTRIKPLTPVRLKISVEEEKIGVTYNGAEIREKDEILNEVVNILEDREEGFKEILEELRNRGFEKIGVNNLRIILKGAVGKELIVAKGNKGKYIYRLNPASQFHTPIYTREAVELDDRSFSFTDYPPDESSYREAQKRNSKYSDDSFTVSRKPCCETDKFKSNPFESIDGVIDLTNEEFEIPDEI